PPLPAGAIPGTRLPAPQRRFRNHPVEGVRSMFRHWSSRVFQTKSRPAPRRRPARPRLGIEQLESREGPTIMAGITPSGQLLVTDTSAVDTVTLDHSGSNTFVNGVPFADSLITNGILIQVGSGVGNLDTVNLLATVKRVTVDGQADVAAVNLGKAGS